MGALPLRFSRSAGRPIRSTSRYALTLNAHLTFGSISIHDVLGKPMFVMSRTFLRDTVRPEELRDAMLEIARRADSVEKQLTRLDEY